MKFISTSKGSEQVVGRQKWASAFEHIIARASSGWETNWAKKLPCLRRQDFFVVTGRFIDGDAPKDFIKVFDEHVRNRIRRSSRQKWTPYIAKAAYKSYPNESIVEHLLNRLGHSLGMNMAESKLVYTHGQVRFLSRYFKKPDEEMIHGAQIYALWLSDTSFVKEIEAQKAESEFFPFQEAERAIRGVFAQEAGVIVGELVRLLVFDAIVGNSDRHFYNWAVVLKRDAGATKITFSPIYDTARGLFWNTSESLLLEKSKKPGDFDDFVKKYANDSKPKMGWENEKGITHFGLFKKLYHEDQRFRDICDPILSHQKLKKMEAILELEFKTLFSPLRYGFILKCLRYRFDTLLQITKKSPLS